jgi:hypothetical protein
VTAAEAQALDILARTVETYHKDIKDALNQTEGRLSASICNIGTRVDEVESHCKAREVQVDAVLAARTVKIDAEIEAAKLEAIQEVKRPSVYKQATKGAWDGLARFAAKATVVVALLSALILLVDRLGLL